MIFHSSQTAELEMDFWRMMVLSVMEKYGVSEYDEISSSYSGFLCEKLANGQLQWAREYSLMSESSHPWEEAPG